MREISFPTRIHSSFLTLTIALATILLATVVGFAQSDNTQISGFVRDAAGAVTPGAKVTVKNEARQFERTAVTNEEGYYVVSNVPPGLYSVTAESAGFKRSTVEDKKVDPGIPATVDIALQTGEVNETVSVVASTSSVQSETATLGKLIEAKQIQYIQLNGRNPLFLALLKPGVSGGALGGFNFGLTTGGLNINGSRTQDNLITFDGAVAVRTRSNGTSIGAADVDSTQEVQILTANYNAEYGRSAGGQVRIVTKSGTRDFHGTAYEYVRNNKFDANSWSRNRSGNQAVQPCSDARFKRAQHCMPEAQRFNQYGYNLNGPVLLPFTKYNRDRNKLFWLFGQEWVKRRRESTTEITVPTLLMRQGNFSELLNPSNRFYGRVVTINDPQTGKPFEGNIIPANRLSPNGLALLKAYPEPIPGFTGTGSNNFIQTRPTTTDQRKDTLSIDWYPSDKHQVRWRLQNYNFVDLSAFRGGTDRAPQIIDRPNQTSSINWTWTLSPTWINEALLAGSRDQVFIAVDQRGDRYKRSNYGINYPYIFNTPKEIQDKIPTVDGLSGFASLDGGPYPSSSTGPIYQFSDNVTNIRGNHTVKFGGYFERAGQNDFDQINVAGTPGGTNNQNGRFVFSNSTAGGTGLAISNAAIGLFDTYAEIGDRSFTPYRGHMVEWFAQDSWKATPKLRLEFGIRHSIIQPYYSLWRNMSVFDPGSYDPSIAVTQDPNTGFITSGNLQSRYNGLVIPGAGFTDAAKGRIRIADTGQYNFLFRGFDKQYSKIHWTDFQPRVGFAYSFNDKTVLRAGAGRFMTRLGVSDSVFLGGNPPFQPTVSVTQGSVDNPGGRSGNVFPLTVTTQDPIFKNPEAWTWNATVQREIGFDTTIEVSYVGRRGLHGQRERNINQLQPGTLQAARAINPKVNADSLRPYKGYGIIRSTNNEANSLYNGLQVGVTRRFTQGFSFGLAYTLSKTMDNGTNQRDVIPNAYDASNLWGPADYDRRHVAVINAIYEFPFFRDRSTLKGKLLGGWTLSAVSQFQTGRPVYIATGDDFAGVGPGSGSQFWNRNGNAALNRGDRGFSQSSTDPVRWFRTTNADGTPIFTAPAAGTFSTQMVRNSGIYAPGFQNHNLGLFKDFYINETQKLTLRMEAFNWVNHPNLGGAEGGGVNTDPRSANFGRVTTKGGERNLQFAIRYSF